MIKAYFDTKPLRYQCSDLFLIRRQPLGILLDPPRFSPLIIIQSYCSFLISLSYSLPRSDSMNMPQMQLSQTCHQPILLLLRLRQQKRTNLLWSCRGRRSQASLETVMALEVGSSSEGVMEEVACEGWLRLRLKASLMTQSSREGWLASFFMQISTLAGSYASTVFRLESGSPVTVPGYGSSFIGNSGSETSRRSRALGRDRRYGGCETRGRAPLGTQNHSVHYYENHNLDMLGGNGRPWIQRKTSAPIDT